MYHRAQFASSSFASVTGIGVSRSFDIAFCFFLSPRLQGRIGALFTLVNRREIGSPCQLAFQRFDGPALSGNSHQNVNGFQHPE
jgi:hypothetical protein